MIPPKSLFPPCVESRFPFKKKHPHWIVEISFQKKKNSDTCGAGGIQRTTFTIHRKCRQWCRAMDARGSVRGLGSVLVEIFQGFGVNTPWWNQRSLVMSRWVVDQGGKGIKKIKKWRIVTVVSSFLMHLKEFCFEFHVDVHGRFRWFYGSGKYDTSIDVNRTQFIGSKNI